MILSSGTSILAAGVISGLCFFLINGLWKGKAEGSKQRRKRSILDDTRCACCLKPFVIDRGVVCDECGARSCRKSCSRWDTPENSWLCLFCYQRRLLQSWLRRNDKWFESFGGVPIDGESNHKFSTAKSQVYISGTEHARISPELGMAAGGEEEENSMETVRDFVEKIVEGLVGNVDETPINRLYDHPAYERLLEKYSVHLARALVRLAVSLQLSITNKPNTDTPTMAHAALRELVERAVEEARKLPRLGGSDSDRTQEGHDMSDQSYEDLLATAILNKVIEKYQTERVDDNSNVLYKKTSPRPKYITSEIEVGLDEGVEEGSSSLEPLSQDECSSDCSAPPSSHVHDRQEPLSLTIEEHIEEVTTTYTSDEEREHVEDDGLDFRNARRVPFPEFGMDIIDPSQESSEDTNDESSTATYVDLVTPIESWEENWLFQKKKMQTQSESVVMLVPNPSADFRALIGDKDAEDTSDLSECSAHSDEEIDEELMEAINNVIPKPSGSPDPRDAGYLERDVGSAKIVGQQVETMTEETRVKTEERGKVVGKLAEVTTKTMEKKEDERSRRIDEVPRVSCKLQVTAEVHKVDALSSRREDVEKREKVAGRTAEVKEKDLEVKVEEIAEDALETLDPKSLEIAGSRKVEGRLEDVEELIEKEKRSIASLDEAEDCETTRKEEVDLLVSVEDRVKDDSLRSAVELRSETMKKEDFTEKIEDELTCPLNLTKDFGFSKVEIGRSQIKKGSSLKECAKLDLRNLDEKMVPVENGIDRQRDTLEANLKSYIRNTEDIHDSLEIGVDNLMAIGKIAEEKRTNGHCKIDLQGEDGAQQESEYTEHYDIATQRHLDSLTRTKVTHREVTRDNNDEAPLPKSSPSSTETLGQCRAALALAEAESARQSQPVERKRVQVDIELATPPRPGTIAEREHKKWENAPPIENNPYSEENIQKRLWERQYAKRSSSEVSGDNTELSKSSDSSLQVVLGANQVDYKRYGRDYYINDAKAVTGDRQRRSTMSNTSRPGSSLSQHSSLTGSDLEQQVETGSISSSDTRSKVTKWQQNNTETNLRQEPTTGKRKIEGVVDSKETPVPTILEMENEQGQQRFKSNVTVTQKSWERREVEEMLEHERKNNKNEINAKLNNQENFDGGACILDVKKSYSDENQRKIHRIDLKAYGFENEFNVKSSSASKSQQRVVNKLDLKSFGYDVGLRRARSINQIDSKINNNANADARTKLVKAKSNLTQHSEYERSISSRNLVECEASGDYCTSKSTETLNDSEGYLEVRNKFNGMTSAKSMPNVTKIEHYTSKIQRYDDEEDIVIPTLAEKMIEIDDEKKLGQQTTNVTSKSHGAWKSETMNLAAERSGLSEICSEDELEELMERAKSTDELTPKKEEFQGPSEVSLTKGKSEKYPKGMASSAVNLNKDEPFLPSVRKLARTFDKTPEIRPIAAPRDLIDEINVSAQVSKSTGNLSKDRSTTPEIQLVETPRQMHSLTARSLSREFREGLRQISNKVTSPPASHMVVVEQPKVSESQSKTDDNVTEDEIGVIAPGRLKNNIKFWEELQRRG